MHPFMEPYETCQVLCKSEREIGIFVSCIFPLRNIGRTHKKLIKGVSSGKEDRADQAVVEDFSIDTF